MEIKLHYTQVKEIELEAYGGSHIEECLREAVLVACLERNNVSFEHNGTIYTVDYRKLISEAGKGK